VGSQTAAHRGDVAGSPTTAQIRSRTPYSSTYHSISPTTVHPTDTHTAITIIDRHAHMAASARPHERTRPAPGAALAPGHYRERDAEQQQDRRPDEPSHVSRANHAAD